MSRELFIALGALLILVILIDGVRRVRNSRYDRIRMSRRKQPIFDDDGEPEFGSELPSGGARVVGVRDEEDVAQLQGEIKQAAEAKKPKLAFETEGATKAKQKPQQTALELDEPTQQDTEAAKHSGSKKPNNNQSGRAADKSVVDEAARPTEVIVFYLRAAKDQLFPGQKLLDTLVAEGMRYGAMEIFHRHSEADGSGATLFSVANSVEPGTFDLNNMDQFTTPGISFFIDLGAVDDPSDAFGIMLDTIAGCMEAMGGELKDETRSAVTKQTVEHYWQRVREFERRTLPESV